MNLSLKLAKRRARPQIILFIPRPTCRCSLFHILRCRFHALCNPFYDLFNLCSLYNQMLYAHSYSYTSTLYKIHHTSGPRFQLDVPMFIGLTFYRGVQPMYFVV